ncbi:MAG TPA: SGNH/GDSL hydrolase family protein, partial [Terriglobus sp.]
MQRFLLLFVLAAFVSLHAQDKPYTQLYVFGDSYSDSGAGYVDGNGPTAVVYLAQRLGIPFTYFGDPKTKEEHPITEGLNFAVSGARTGDGKGSYGPHGELLGGGMLHQVNEFADLVKAGDVRFDPKQTMFFLLGGLNDGHLPAGETRANEEVMIDTLYALGGRRFIVGLLPVKIAGFTAAGIRANTELETLPAEVNAKYPDIQIALSHWGTFYDLVITHPTQYGFTNTTDKCAGRALRNEDTTPCATPQSYFFYHD